MSRSATHKGLCKAAIDQAAAAVDNNDWEAARAALSVALLTAEAALRAEGKL